jgi:hypothetical protein
VSKCPCAHAAFIVHPRHFEPEGDFEAGPEQAGQHRKTDMSEPPSLPCVETFRAGSCDRSPQEKSGPPVTRVGTAAFNGSNGCAHPPCRTVSVRLAPQGRGAGLARVGPARALALWRGVDGADGSPARPNRCRFGVEVVPRACETVWACMRRTRRLDIRAVTNAHPRSRTSYARPSRSCAR